MMTQASARTASLLHNEWDLLEGKLLFRTVIVAQRKGDDTEVVVDARHVKYNITFRGDGAVESHTFS